MCVALLVVAVVGAALLLGCETAVGDVSQAYRNELVLTNISSELISADSLAHFAEEVASLLQTATGQGTFDVAAVRMAPNIVLPFFQWVSGTAAEVESKMVALNSLFASWQSTMDEKFVCGLNGYSVSNFGVQPATVDVSGSCGYTGQVLPASTSPECPRNLTVVLHTTVAPPKTLSAQLCLGFGFRDCNVISVDRVSQVSEMEFTVPVTFLSAERDDLLVRLVDRLTFASSLAPLAIFSAKVENVAVFTQGNPMQLSYEGDWGTCASHFWYLIFFLVLLPLVLILLQKCFRMGKVAGRKAILKTEKDIRAGIHITANPTWGSVGYYGGVQQLPSQYAPHMQSGMVQRYHGQQQQLMHNAGEGQLYYDIAAGPPQQVQYSREQEIAAQGYGGGQWGPA